MIQNFIMKKNSEIEQISSQLNTNFAKKQNKDSFHFSRNPNELKLPNLWIKSGKNFISSEKLSRIDEETDSYMDGGNFTMMERDEQHQNPVIFNHEEKKNKFFHKNDKKLMPQIGNNSQELKQPSILNKFSRNLSAFVESYKEKNHFAQRKTSISTNSNLDFDKKFKNNLISHVESEKEENSFRKMIKPNSAKLFLSSASQIRNVESSLPAKSFSSASNKLLQSSIKMSSKAELELLSQKINQINSNSSANCQGNIISGLISRKSERQSTAKLSTNRLEMTINQSCKADRTRRQEFVLALCENKARQIGFCAFSSFSARIVCGSLIDTMLYENVLIVLSKFYPIEILFPQNHSESVIHQKVREKFTDSKIFLLQNNYFNENIGFSIYKTTKNYKFDFDLDKNYLAFGSLAAISNLFNGFHKTQIMFSENFDKNKTQMFAEAQNAIKKHNFDHLRKNIIHEKPQFSEKIDNNETKSPKSEQKRRLNEIQKQGTAEKNGFKNKLDFLNEKCAKILSKDPNNGFKSQDQARTSEVNHFRSDNECDLNITLLTIEIYEFDKYLLIDYDSIRDLELIQNLENNKKGCSLASIFKCRTFSGLRLLRGCLCQPLKSIQEIEDRQTIVQSFMIHKHLFNFCIERFVRFNKSDNLVLRFMKKISSESISSKFQLFSTLTDLYHFLKEFTLFYEDFQIKFGFSNTEKQGQFDFCSELFKKDAYDKSVEVLKVLDTELDFSATRAKNNKKENMIFLLKDQENVFVNISKHSYIRFYENMLDLFENYKELVKRNHFGELQLKFSNSRKYFLQLKFCSPNHAIQRNDIVERQKDLSNDELNEKSDLSSDFEIISEDEQDRHFKQNNISEKHKIWFKNAISKAINQEVILCKFRGSLMCFTTPSFSNLNAKIEKFNDEIMEQSFSKVEQVYNSLRKDLYFLIDLNYSIAYFDMLLSFAETSNILGFNFCPHFTNNAFKGFKIQNSKNIVLLETEKFTNQCFFNKKAQTYFSYEGNNYKLIFGQNGSGKTLYLKNLAHLIVLAQNGCFLPCQKAVLNIFDRIRVKFNIIVSHENVISNFTSEVIFINNLLCNFSEQTSLILFDDFVKSTNQEEAHHYLFAFLECLRNKQNCFLFLTSSNPELFRLTNNCHFVETVVLKNFNVIKPSDHDYEPNINFLNSFSGQFWELMNKNICIFDHQITQNSEENASTDDFNKAAWIFFDGFVDNSFSREDFIQKLRDLLLSYTIDEV